MAEGPGAGEGWEWVRILPIRVGPPASCTLCQVVGRAAALASRCVWGCPSPPPSAWQTQLTLMGSEQDRTAGRR